MTVTYALMSAILVLVLLGNYLQTKERTADRKARAARDARLDVALTELEVHGPNLPTALAGG
jgi:hypothetical protein